MNELLLKYGCNPNQKPSKIYMLEKISFSIWRLQETSRSVSTLFMAMYSQSRNLTWVKREPR